MSTKWTTILSGDNGSMAKITFREQRTCWWLKHFKTETKRPPFSKTKFSDAFSWMKMYKVRLKFHWSLFPRVRLTRFQHWFITAWRRPGDKRLSEPMIISLLTHICVTRPQWVNTVFCVCVWQAKYYHWNIGTHTYTGLNHWQSLFRIFR